jgi:hypothetical protein
MFLAPPHHEFSGQRNLAILDGQLGGPTILLGISVLLSRLADNIHLAASTGNASAPALSSPFSLSGLPPLGTGFNKVFREAMERKRRRRAYPLQFSLAHATRPGRGKHPEPVPRFAGACAIQVKQLAASPPSRLQRWLTPVRRLATTIIVDEALLSVLLAIGTNL